MQWENGSLRFCHLLKVTGQQERAGLECQAGTCSLGPRPPVGASVLRCRPGAPGPPLQRAGRLQGHPLGAQGRLCRPSASGACRSTRKRGAEPRSPFRNTRALPRQSSRDLGGLESQGPRPPAVWVHFGSDFSFLYYVRFLLEGTFCSEDASRAACMSAEHLCVCD